jgi:hypothetical protein
MKEKEDCYINLIARLDGLEVQLGRVGEQLRELKSFLVLDDGAPHPRSPTTDTSALETIQDMCLESLLDVESQGDA